MVGLIFLFLFLGLVLIGLPISATIGIATIITIFITGKFSILYIVISHLSEGVQKYSLLAIPFFILAANLMNETSITDKIFDFASKLVGHLKGGLAQANVVASMIFAGVSGAAVSDAAGLGTIEVKAMSEKGYSREYTAGITLASSMVGPLIPPSIPLIVFAVLSQESVARLLLAGIIPGFLTGGVLMLMNFVYGYRKKDFFPPPEKFPGFRVLLRSMKDSILALLAPVIIIGGLVWGYVTATEVSVVAVLYAVLVGLIYKGPSYIFKIIPKVLTNSLKTSAILMYVLANASAMSWLMTREKIPNSLANMILGLTDNPYCFLVIVLIFYLFLGTLIDGVPAQLITVPILLPIALDLGIDPIWFGMIVVYAILVGMCTPPIGIGLFVMTKVANISFEDMVKSFLPFFVPVSIVLILVTFFPVFSTWLPNLIMGAR